MVWPRVKEGRGGYHQEDVKHASARREKKGKAQEKMVGQYQEDMKEYRMTEDMAQTSKCVAREDKGRPIATWRRPLGEKVRSMLAVVLVPIIKDKTGRIDRTDNYRPIALASMVSKVVERILLDRISHFLETWPNQFGFKPSLGTDTYVLKEMVDKYKSLNGGIYMCFFDASKAFDRVKHSVLFNKLTRRGVPAWVYW